MKFAIEFSTESERDFELIFEHLFESYVGFGESREAAFGRAAKRIKEIRKAAERLATFPNRAAARDDVLPGLRYLVIDRAIYWFDIEEPARKIRILAIFFGGQDHIRHMLVRLLQADE
jgi:plasmid stabilization system protein ParE